MNPHQPYETSVAEIGRSFSRNFSLICQMTKREILGRYRGSLLGLAWSFFNPLLMLGVYTFFFSFVFRARWGGEQTSHANFAIVLFVGLLVHGLFAECVNRAPILIIGNVSYVKRVIFPLEIFPWVAVGSAIFHAAISVLVLLLLQLLVERSIPWTVIFLPLVLVPLVLVAIGASWFLSATGVYVKDIGQITGLITTILLFVSPVFYPTSQLPPKLQAVVVFNPLTVIIEESRQVLLFGQMPNWRALAIYFVVSIIVAWAGFWWFQKTRKGFADVI